VEGLHRSALCAIGHFHGSLRFSLDCFARLAKRDQLRIGASFVVAAR
jgi:hypothetical protein